MAPLLLLLVDDDELSLEITGLQLAALGHTVAKAATGAAALNHLVTAGRTSSRMPDAIITDLQMPDMDGRALCRQVRLLKAVRTPRIYAMSATRLNNDQLPEFDGFLLKPLDLKALEKTLSQPAGPQIRINPALQKFPPASVAPMPEPALDSTILRKLGVLMPPAALDELLTAYVSDTRTRVSQLESYAAAGEHQALRSCAHMIKGSAAMTGATRVARLASMLESGELAPDRQKALIDELRCACDAIAGTLAREDRLRDTRMKETHDHQVPRIG